ncbi:hypothetical protein SLEP1_g38210 [Rubroshorea leprosula]|uniref:Uncharacterized protein n=1 Tax=Rubroshorea leprosula TaxID=152421 RepID=A0AAV5KX52_9ROSI|nr:hypothetical protein SLEP1_g38210 [Rubroshorea leprosula]
MDDDQDSWYLLKTVYEHPTLLYESISKLPHTNWYAMTQKKHQHNDHGRRPRLMVPLDRKNLQEEPTAILRGVLRANYHTHCCTMT